MIILRYNGQIWNLITSSEHSVNPKFHASRIFFYKYLVFLLYYHFDIKRHVCVETSYAQPLGLVLKCLSIFHLYKFFSSVEQDLDGVEEFIRMHKDKLVAIGEVMSKGKAAKVL